MELRVESRQIRKSAPRAPSLLLPALLGGLDRFGVSRSGATRRSQPIVRIAAASFMFWERREDMRLDVISCIASSVWE